VRDHWTVAKQSTSIVGMSTPSGFASLRHELAADRAALVDHAVYAHVRVLGDVRTFMEQHVFAVWDFMSLLKSLQRELTCVNVPWVPRGDPEARRLVNEIVLAEESDDGVGTGYTSHFELYLAAMRQCGADVRRVEEFVARVASGSAVRDALVCVDAPAAAQRFVEQTFMTIESRSIPRIAAAFTIGREDVIPDMFARLVTELSRESGGRLALLEDYLKRHIHLDGERHGPMASRMLQSVCGDDERCWREALVGGREALVARRALWDAIAATLASQLSLAGRGSASMHTTLVRS
jgi:hypothetical protein